MAIAIRKGEEVYFNYSTLLEECNYLYGVSPRMRKDVMEKIRQTKRLFKKHLSTN